MPIQTLCLKCLNPCKRELPAHKQMVSCTDYNPIEKGITHIKKEVTLNE